jgi:hypothetical protein
MAEKNIFDTLTQYRLKVEKDGKSVVDVPGILALPGLLAFPKLSIAGMIAAPVLGMKVRLEGGDGKPVDVEGAVRKAAETVKETAAAAAKTVKEEVDKAWEAVSADDPEETEEAEETAETDGDDIPSIHVEDPDQH